MIWIKSYDFLQAIQSESADLFMMQRTIASVRYKMYHEMFGFYVNHARIKSLIFLLAILEWYLGKVTAMPYFHHFLTPNRSNVHMTIGTKPHHRTPKSSRRVDSVKASLFSGRTRRLEKKGKRLGGLCSIYLYCNTLLSCLSERMGESHVASVSVFCKAL